MNEEQQAVEVQPDLLDRSKQFAEVQGWLLPETQGPPVSVVNVTSHPTMIQRYIHNHNVRDG